MVLMLARVLDVPLRDRNDLLTAAGYAAMYRATDLDAPDLEQARRAVDFMLRQQEPYPAIAVDRAWTILKANGGAARLVEAFTDPSAAAEWAATPCGDVPSARLSPAHRELGGDGGGADSVAAPRCAERSRRRRHAPPVGRVTLLPGVPPRWRTLDLDASTAPFLAIEFRKDDLELRFFSTLTSLGTPHDITLQSCGWRRSFRRMRRRRRRQDGCRGHRPPTRNVEC